MLGGGAAAFGSAAYSGLIEPNEIEVKRLELRVRRFSETFDGFKIGLISDFHFGPHCSIAMNGENSASMIVRPSSGQP